ncbi:hypothetical protein WAE56_16140 [Iodobacter sp. LRB]
MKKYILLLVITMLTACGGGGGGGGGGQSLTPSPGKKDKPPVNHKGLWGGSYKIIVMWRHFF